MSGSGGSWRPCVRRRPRHCLYWLGLRLGMGCLGGAVGRPTLPAFSHEASTTGRTFMPEALMILLSVGALWAFARWIDRQSPMGTSRWLPLLAALCFPRQNTYPLSRFSAGRLSLGALGVALRPSSPFLWLYLVLALGTRRTLVLARQPDL